MNLDPSAINDFNRADKETQQRIKKSNLRNIRMVHIFGSGFRQWCGQPIFKDCVGGLHLDRYIPIEK